MLFFLFNDPPTTELDTYCHTLSLHDALPISFSLVLTRANRHGLITGATGTGMTVTLQRIAEGFARAGVPVFAADVKGDLAGIAAPREAGGSVPPAIAWDIFGRSGHPVRTTITEFGPLLLAQLLELNATQSGVLEVVFKIGRAHV